MTDLEMPSERSIGASNATDRARSWLQL